MCYKRKIQFHYEPTEDEKKIENLKGHLIVAYLAILCLTRTVFGLFFGGL